MMNPLEQLEQQPRKNDCKHKKFKKTWHPMVMECKICKFNFIKETDETN